MADLQVVGANELALKFGSLGDNFPGRVRAGMRLGAEYFQERMRSEKLSGQLLRVRSDRLRGGWGIADLSSGTDVLIALGTKVPYARVQNDGFEGDVVVREHTRRPSGVAAKKERRRVARLGPKGKERALREAEGRARDRDMARNRAPGLGIARRLRREAGQQAGIAPLSESGQRQKASGVIVVRSHGRHMRIRGKHYVEKSVVDFRAGTVKIVEQYVLKGVADGQ